MTNRTAFTPSPSAHWLTAMPPVVTADCFGQ
jgi:hypothetical protein